MRPHHCHQRHRNIKTTAKRSKGEGARKREKKKKTQRLNPQGDEGRIEGEYAQEARSGRLRYNSRLSRVKWLLIN